VHQQGQGTHALRVRREGRHRHHAARQPDRGGSCVRRQPLRRTHARRADRAGDDPDAGHRRRTAHGVGRPWLPRRGRRQPGAPDQAPGQEEAAHRVRSQDPQATPGDRACDRAPEGRSPHGALPSEGGPGRQDACGAVRSRVQHQVAAADDRQKRPEGFFVSASGHGGDNRRRQTAARIPSATRPDELRSSQWTPLVTDRRNGATRDRG